MMDYTITATKQFTFDCAHMLSGHEGECKNLHGHTYQLFVTVARDGYYPLQYEGADNGMVMDFKELKSIVQETILDEFDHAFICWKGGNDVELALRALTKHHQLKVKDLDFRPTAENMALYIGQVLQVHFPYGLVLLRVKLYETSTSFAEYRIGGSSDG